MFYKALVQQGIFLLRRFALKKINIPQKKRAANGHCYRYDIKVYK